MSEQDRAYMRRLAASLLDSTNDAVDTPAADSDDAEEPAEVEFHRRAARLGKVRGGP